MDMQEIWAQLREPPQDLASAPPHLGEPPATKIEFGPESNSTVPVPPPGPKLLDQVRRAMRVAHYAIRTEQAYVDWIRRFSYFITNATLMRWERLKSPSF